MARKSKSYLNADGATEWMQIMLAGRSIEDRQDVSDRNVHTRLALMAFGALALFGLLSIRLFSVQVGSSQDFIALANGNRVREVISYAPRGKIYDRNGVVLADNSLGFQLSMTPYLLDEDNEEAENDIKRVAQLSGINMGEITQALDTNGRQYVLPLVVTDVLTHEQALRLEAEMPNFKGFSLDQVPSRTYKSDWALAHVVGYTGRVSQSDLDNDTTGTLLPTDFRGKTGAELSFDERLRGENGWIRFEVDALGRPIRIIDQKDPERGEDIHLSIDVDVQKAMYEGMIDQMNKSNTTRSSGVAVSPENGEVFAMVSLPTYDNNLFVGGIASADFSRLVNDTDQPLYNKVIAGGYTTGSIIKPLVASAALQENVVSPETIIVDSGALTLPGGFTFRGWRPEGLGPMNVRSGIAWSSNIYFYTVGGGFGGIGGLGEERLTNYYRQYGLGEQTGINLPNEIAGRVPDEEWKLENTGEPWYQGDSYNISIGQGDLLVSPLQITMAEAAIANNGYLLTPQIELGAERSERREIPVSKSNLQIVREGMRQVMTNGTTCDCIFKNVGEVVAGKSGTAETDTDGGKRPNAWFTAYAPYDQTYARKPEISATVLVEEGSGGSRFAAPVIARAFEAYYAKY